MNATEALHTQGKYEVLRQVVDDTIALALIGVEPAPLRDAVLHAVAGGKRIRPLVTLSMCGAVGGEETDALPAAAAVELLHTSSLIHDDIMDSADMRRGRRTLHDLHGTPMAILAGDILVAHAFRLMRMIKPQKRASVMDWFTGAFVHVCEGQGYDLTLSNDARVRMEDHRAMVEKKTARLLEASAAIGAAIGTDDDQIIRGAALFGYHIGMAFQAHDDLLDATGNEVVMGKPVAVDQRNGKATYLTLAYPNAGASEVDVDSINKVRTLVVHHTRIACMFLENVPDSSARDFLRTLALSLVNRQS